MYLKKISVNKGIVTYYCKSKSQGKRWLRSQGLTKQVTCVCEASLAFIAPGNSDNYARLFWRDYASSSGWTIHHLPPGV